MITTRSSDTPCRTTVTTGRIRIADAPKDGRGGATGLCRPELLEAALASCPGGGARLAADALHLGPAAVGAAVALVAVSLEEDARLEVAP